MESISLAAPVLAHVGSFPITNTVLASWLTMAVLIVIGGLATRGRQLIPVGIQNGAELVVDGGYTAA